MNLAIVIGNLGKDAEIGETDKNKRWTRLSVATSESWKDKTTGEKREKTEWHRVTVWGDGYARYLGEKAKKGIKVEVRGKVTTSKWKGKDGQDRYTTEIVVQGADSSVLVIGKLGEGGPPPPSDAPEGRYGNDGYDQGNFGDE